MTADFWYTAWVNAGQPDLNALVNIQMELPEEKFEYREPLDVREHEGFSSIPSAKTLKQAFLSALWRPGL